MKSRATLVAPLDEVLGGAVNHRVGRLLDVNLSDLLALLDHLGREVGDADVANLALLLEELEGAHRLGERSLSVGPVHEVEVDVVGAEVAQRALDLPHDVLERGVAVIAGGTGDQANLGREQVALSVDAPERVADDLLGRAVAIARRGVDEVDAVIEHGADGGHAGGVIVLTKGVAADRPGAHSELGDVDIGILEVRVAHVLSF